MQLVLCPLIWWLPNSGQLCTRDQWLTSDIIRVYDKGVDKQHYNKHTIMDETSDYTSRGK